MDAHGLPSVAGSALPVCPSGKVPLSSAREGRAWVRSTRSTGERPSDLHPYRCHLCGWVHLTSMSRGRFRDARRRRS